MATYPGKGHMMIKKWLVLCIASLIMINGVQCNPIGGHFGQIGEKHFAGIKLLEANAGGIEINAAVKTADGADDSGTADDGAADDGTTDDGGADDGTGASNATPSEGGVFDVMKYGAKANGRNDDGMAFIRAWRAACTSTGAAKVLIPPGNYMAGEVIFAGPCKAQPPITVEIQGNVSANTDPSTYTSGGWIMIERVDNVVVTGGGIINGRGETQWQYASRGTKSSSEAPLTVSLEFQGVGFGKLYNLSFVNSMGFHIKVHNSNDVSLYNLNISAPGKSPNTDGIHISKATNVNVTDSIIGTGDDCISIGHSTENILISGIRCGPGHGLSVGSLGKRPDEESVKGITVKNCTLVGTTNGARIKSFHDSPKMDASDIIFEDIVMDQVKNPIIIDQHYHSKEKPQQSNVKISNVRFSNIRGTTISEIPISLNCSSAVPCEGIELSNIELTPFGSIDDLQSTCANAKTILTGTLKPPGPKACK